MAVHMFSITRPVHFERHTPTEVITDYDSPTWTFFDVLLKAEIIAECSKLAHSLYPNEIEALNVDLDESTRQLVVTFGSSMIPTPVEQHEIEIAFDKWFIVDPTKPEWCIRLTDEWLVVGSQVI